MEPIFDDAHTNLKEASKLAQAIEAQVESVSPDDLDSIIGELNDLNEALESKVLGKILKELSAYHEALAGVLDSVTTDASSINDEVESAISELDGITFEE